MKSDMRVVHTEKLLRAAYFELLREDPERRVTPTELCRRATVNRNTFYSHYESVDQLRDKIESELLSAVISSLKNSASGKEALCVICRMLKENENFAAITLDQTGSRRFLRNIIAIANESNLTKLNREQSDMDADYKNMLSAFTIHGAIAILRYWIETGMRQPEEEIAAFIERACTQGTRSLSRRQPKS